uniref:Thioredoxin domain-containing protein n=1 Tax=Pyrodinium bahamense TaxID=73915 RepID=A0A7S0BCA2_9DINO
MPVQVHVLSVTSPLAELLGNPTVIHASGQPVTLEEALGDAQYLAVCFSASYCPSCKKFMPALEYAYLQGGLESDKKCKVLLGGGDKTAEAFDAYRGKYPQFLSLGFEETQPLKTVLRDTWKVSTIPHVVLLDCRTAQVIQSNARFLIEGNPRCDGFPWNKEDNHTTIDMTKAASKSGDDTPQQHWTLGARIWKRPRFYQLGHFAKKGSSSMYMDENAVRARAGLLNITSWMAIINIFLFIHAVAHCGLGHACGSSVRSHAIVPLWPCWHAARIHLRSGRAALEACRAQALCVGRWILPGELLRSGGPAAVTALDDRGRDDVQRGHLGGICSRLLCRMLDVEHRDRAPHRETGLPGVQALRWCVCGKGWTCDQVRCQHIVSSLFRCRNLQCATSPLVSS